MNHYANYFETGIELTRDCWPKDNAFTWIRGIYNACKSCQSKYLIVMEDDTFILRPISILNQEFGISVFEYNASEFPTKMLNIVEQLGGNTDIPVNIFGVKGYGAGGGFILNCEQFVDSWNRMESFLDENYEILKSVNKLIGWCDFLPQFIIMLGGYEVVMNSQMIQTWYNQRPDLYPTFTHWQDYEIVDFLKDIEQVRML